MSALGKLWTVYNSYSPEEARRRREERKNNPQRYGAFVATYRPPNLGVRRPRNDAEAQRLYNHIRTVAFWLDSAPVLADLGLPFRAGIDDIISLVPIYGDIASGVLQLYQVFLCFLFGVPRQTLMLMLFNVILDVVVGIVPLIGDLLDNLFKSNLRNLTLLEDWLLNTSSSSSASTFHILLMPETDEFLPTPSTRTGHGGSGGGAGVFGGWFGWGANSSSTSSGGSKKARAKRDREEEREQERMTGRVKRTRRMDGDDAAGWGAEAAYAAKGASAGAGAAGGAYEASRAGPSRGTRSQRASAAGGPAHEPLD